MSMSRCNHTWLSKKYNHGKLVVLIRMNAVVLYQNEFKSLLGINEHLILSHFALSYHHFF